MRKDIFTDSNFELYQSIRTFVTRKGLEKKKKEHFKKFLTMLLEMGHPTHFRRDLPDFLGLAPRGDREAPKIYWGLQEFISENTRVQGLTFNQLDLLARLYFGVVIATLLANFAHCPILRLSNRLSNRFSNRLSVAVSMRVAHIARVILENSPEMPLWRFRRFFVWF